LKNIRVICKHEFETRYGKPVPYKPKNIPLLDKMLAGAMVNPIWQECKHCGKKKRAIISG
jgi:hypothetical protein